MLLIALYEYPVHFLGIDKKKESGYNIQLIRAYFWKSDTLYRNTSFKLKQNIS